MDLSITQGIYFYQRFTGLDSSSNAINLSGYTVSGYVRYSYGSSGILLDLAPTIVSGLNGASYQSGLIDVSLPRNSTTGCPVTKALYSIEIYSGDSYSRIVDQGSFTINPQITY